MSRGTPTASAVILPDRFCVRCDVMWVREAGHHCWVCGSVGSAPAAPQTTEERADLAVNTLLLVQRAKARRA